MIGRIPILDVQPVVACGQYPAKAVVGEPVDVTATVFREGHDAVNAEVLLCGPGDDGRPAEVSYLVPLAPGTDRWGATVVPDRPGVWSFAIRAWADPVRTWRDVARIKVPAGIDVELVFGDGAALLERAARTLPRGRTAERQVLRDAARALKDGHRPDPVRLAAAEDPDVLRILHEHPLRDLVTESESFPLLVERERALFGAWYEFFPRSEGARQVTGGRWVSGTLRTAALRLPAVAAMGFDVVYLPPVHPIGTSFRKGPNNSLVAGPGDPGSPWAIGSPAGGHDALHPDLGTFEDFDAFVARARELGMEVALDLALQASPDHPWVTEHPEWFSVRSDGSIAYAENPPKKYQDIYPIDFDRDPDGIYAEILRIVRHWMAHGVRIFRVDNPHTKPLRLWQWLIETVRATDPDVLFLAEAFTRPAVMRALAMVGFQQSYTYFTWRNGRDELEQYFTELSRETSPYMRPNVFVNTPDILHAYLQYGGPAAFRIRAILASTLSPTWGVYSGFELFEHVAVRPGSEEYIDSEKYQYRPRDWAAYEPGGRRDGESLAPLLTTLNGIRTAHPALRLLRNLRFHRSDHPSVLCYSKSVSVSPAPGTGAGGGGAEAGGVAAAAGSAGGADGAGGERDTVIVVVNLDPHAVAETTLYLDMPALGMDWHETFWAHDDLTGRTYHWGEHPYVRLDPGTAVAHVLHVRRSPA